MDYLNNLIQNLSSSFGNVIPGVFGALIVLLIGFLLAKMIRKLVERLLRKTNIDERIAKNLNITNFRVDKFIAKLIYYIIVIYTLMIVLNLLGVEGVLAPVEDMLNKFVGFLPNVIGAGIIAFAGYILSSIGSEATGFLSERIEKFGHKVGINTGGVKLSKIFKQIVFVIIFIPILIVALDTLKMSAISEPATEMLSSILDAIPRIIAAVLLLGIFYIVGKYIVAILSDILSNMGLDNLSEGMGLSSVLGGNTLSGLIGKVAMFFIMFTGIIAATDKLELGQVQDIMNEIFNISGKVFFGLLILLAGTVISNWAAKALQNGSNAYMAPLVRFAILGIFLAFALHTMGIAESIVNLAFGLTLGAVAVAFALSFGLGGREAAGKQMEHFFEGLRNKKNQQ